MERLGDFVFVIRDLGDRWLGHVANVKTGRVFDSPIYSGGRPETYEQKRDRLIADARKDAAPPR